MKMILTPNLTATGWMSQKFVKDLLVARPDALATHQVVAIGSSSISKAEKFVSDVITPSSSSSSTPKLYDSYEGVYANPDVDVVYVGTPHTLHKQNCLDAIEKGKNVLCEKPFTINAREAEEVISKARSKGVYIMEGERHEYNSPCTPHFFLCIFYVRYRLRENSTR